MLSARPASRLRVRINNFSKGPMKVLKRQALVHNVVYADDTQTADAIVQYWKSSSMRQLRLNTTTKYYVRFGRL